MPIEVPEVRVVDDPLVVFILVGLFAAAALLAVWFATPWAARMPRSSNSMIDAARADPPPPRIEKVPWSTTMPDPDPPWHARPPNAGRHED